MKPHGTYSIELINRVLFVDATGPFNEDAVKNYSTDLKVFTEKLAPEPWALCAVFRNESLFTPEAEDQLTAVTEWRKEMGMKAVAIIFNEIKGLNILKAQMERIYRRADVPYSFFYDNAEAFSWLAKIGYQANPPK